MKIGKQDLSVVQYTNVSIHITEHVKNGKRPYRASIVDGLTKKQALALGLLLIKAAQS